MLVMSIASEEQARELDEELRFLSAADARVQRLIGQGLVRLWPGHQIIQLGYAKPVDYARERLGISGREAEELALIERIIVGYPETDRLWSEGCISRCHVRLILRHVKCEDDFVWARLASHMSVRGSPWGAAGGKTRLSDRLQVDSRGLHPLDEPPAGSRMEFELPPEEAIRFDVGHEMASNLMGEDLSAADFIELCVAELQAGCPSALWQAADDADADWVAQRRREQTAWREQQERTTERRSRSWADLSWDHRPACIPDFTLASNATVFDIDERLRQAVAFGQEVHALYLRRLLEAEQNSVDRILGFASFRHYARERLGLSPTRKDALLRVQRGMADLPAVAEAYATGVLTLSQVEEVVRIATTETAAAWVAYARNTTVRRLRDVVKQGKRLQGRDPMFPPELKPVEGVLETVFPQLASPAPTTPQPTCAPRVPDTPITAPVRMQLVMDADQEAFVRPGLAMAKAVIGPHATVAQAIALLVDLFIFEWHATASKAEKTHSIETRDGWRCTTPGCTQKVGLDAHHLEYRSRGGGDEDWNQSTVCSFHHLRGIHEGHVRAQGKAPDGIVWALGMRPDGRPTEVFLGDRRLYG